MLQCSSMAMGYSTKNKQKKPGVNGWRTWSWKFPRGILEKGQEACINSWGQLKREVEFPGMFKKNSCGISMGLEVFDLDLETSKHKAGVSHTTILQNFQSLPMAMQW